MIQQFLLALLKCDSDQEKVIKGILLLCVLYCLNAVRIRFAQMGGDSASLDSRKLSGPYNELGKGAFGCVYKGQYRDGAGRKPVALKLFKGERGRFDLNHEKAQLEKLGGGHENIVKFYGKLTLRQGAIYNPWALRLIYDPIPQAGYGESLVFEFADHGTLASYMSSNRLSVAKQKELSQQITQGLEFLHAKNLVHQDLKPDNILIFGRNRVAKIADFGVARARSWRVTIGNHTLATATADYGPGGTPLYAAPEVLNAYEQSIRAKDTAQGELAKSSCTSKSDIFSLGIIFWEIANNGKRPTRSSAEMYEGAFFNASNRPVKTLPFDRVIPECVEKNSGRRPTASRLLRYFS